MLTLSDPERLEESSNLRPAVSQAHLQSVRASAVEYKKQLTVPNERRQVVRIFLASPSDLAPERVIAKDIVDKINARWADFLSLQIELVGWEDSVSVYGRPQDTINQDLARCEFFIGMLWHEWGKPNGRFDSGFEEEFTLSEVSFRKTGRPAISLLFKDMDQSRLRDKGPGLTRVLRFKEEVNGKILYKTFGTENEFRQRFEHVVTDYLQGLKAAEQSHPVQEAPVTDKEHPDSAIPANDTQAQIPNAAVQFIRQFAGRAETGAGTEPLSVVEIARFRLLGSLVGEQGNDEALLGVHDANILYADAQDVTLTFEERAALLDCGLANFGAENVPYWKWLVSIDGLETDAVATRTIVGPDSCRVGALKLLRLMHKAIFRDKNGRSEYVEVWLAPTTPHAEKKAALDYLSEFGSQQDLDTIKTEIDRADYQTMHTAMHAYAAIELRESADKALEALIKLQPESIERTLLDKLFSRPQILSTSWLEACLTHKAPQLRARSASELIARDAVSREAADNLCLDADPEVRLQGLLGRLAAGESISEDSARTVLVSRKRKLGLGALAFAASSTEGEQQFERFKLARRKSLSLPDLRREASLAMLLDQSYRFEEIRRSFRTEGHLLRTAVNDRFSEWFDMAFEDFAKVVGNPDTLQKVKDLRDSFRREWTRAALTLIVAKGDCQDLPLVREALQSEFVDVVEDDIRFLAKCGEWKDIDTVLLYLKSPTRSGLGSILGSYLSAPNVTLASEALLSIAKDRTRDMLALDMDERIKATVLKEVSAKEFRKFSSAELMAFLTSSDDKIRRAAALKIVVTLPTSRVSALQRGYMSHRGSRYYNVVLWLDLGVSFERSVAVAIAKRAMASDN